MKQYLSFIRKADFTDLFKYGKLYVNRDTTTIFDCDVNDLQDNPGVFDELVKSANSFDSSFVYLIIHYQKNDNDNPYDVNIEDLCHIYPLDSEAKANFISSFDERIRIEEPIWADAVFKLQQKQLFNECRKGAQNIWNIFKFDEPIAKCEEIITDEILVEVVSQLFENRRPKGELPIWVYLLRYERHSSYPKNTIGFFFDTYNVICNNWKQDEFFEDDIRGTNIYTFLQSKYDTTSGFASIYAELCATEECKPFLQLVDSFESRVDFFKIAFWYLYLRDKYKNGLFYEPNFISEAKVKIGDEFQYAAYLLGLKLGHEHTYDCLYEELPLAIFKSKAQLFKEKEAKRLELERFQEEERRREEERRFREEEERNKKYGKRGYGDAGFSYGGYSPKWGEYSDQKSYRHGKGKSKGTSKAIIPSRMNPKDKYAFSKHVSYGVETPADNGEALVPNVSSATEENKINQGLTPEPAAATTEPAAATPEPAAATPEPLDATPEPITASPEPLDASPEPITASPEPITATLEPLDASPEPIVATPEPVAVPTSTEKVPDKGTVSTDDVATAHSGNFDSSTLRKLPHFPAKMVKLTNDGKVKKSPRPKLANNVQEYAKMLDEGWVLEPKVTEQLMMFNDNKQIQ